MDLDVQHLLTEFQKDTGCLLSPRLCFCSTSFLQACLPVSREALVTSAAAKPQHQPSLAPLLRVSVQEAAICMSSQGHTAGLSVPFEFAFPP